MKSHSASLINALILIIFGSWAYFSSEDPSFTALIPVFAGIILIFLNRGIKNSNKVIGHIAVLITLLILIGLIKPLSGAIERDDMLALFRVGVMILATLYALIIFIREFILLRKQK